MIRLLAAMPIALAIAAPAAAAPKGDEAELAHLVDAFLAAQQGFDQAMLAQLTTQDYVEISPLGEVDPRDRMLGFYAPDKKQPAPPIVVSERSTRVQGDTGIVIARLTYGSAAARAVYVARRTALGWSLVSAQFTPIRERPPS